MPETLPAEAVLFKESQPTSPAVALSMIGIGVVVFGGALLLNARAHRLAEATPPLLLGVAVFLGVTGLLVYSRLETTVTTTGAIIAYRPWRTLRLGPEDIAGVSMRHFGLWDGGIGYHPGPRSTAITARTGDGVVITRPDGHAILVGTQHPDAFYSALLQLQSTAKGGGHV